MAWKCVACEEQVGKHFKLGGIIPTSYGVLIMCDDCYGKWEPRDR